VTWYGQEVRKDKITTRRLHILRECPITFISEFSRDIVRLHAWSQAHNGALPDSGGINDQTAVVMEALSVVRDEFSKVEVWRSQQARQQAEREAKRDKFTGNRR
jgi:hypothetical protein